MQLSPRMFRLLEILGFFKVFKRLKHVKINFEITAEVTSGEARDSHLVVETLAYLALPVLFGVCYVSMRNCFSEM